MEKLSNQIQIQCIKIHLLLLLNYRSNNAFEISIDKH